MYKSSLVKGREPSAAVEFWSRLRSGIEVAVPSASPDKLLGIRDGFRRYFHDGLDRPVPVVVVPHSESPEVSELPLSDREILELARRRAVELHDELGDAYPFYAASEAGIHSLDIAENTFYFVRNWTVVRGVAGEAFGGSGSVQLPESLIQGLDRDQIPFAVPGKRRQGGMISSLTGGLETRRSAIAVSCLHAISTLFYGVLESRPIRSR